MKKCVYLVILGFLIANCSSSSDTAGGSSISGVWTRLPGPSGDRTDLAVGGIDGEPSERVYMCEKIGSTAAGFYKGTLNGNNVIWDAIYSLPDTHLRMVGEELEFSYPSIDFSIPTLYQSGNWSGECGPLENSSGNSTGYNCVNGNCIAVNSGAQYSTLSSCQSYCSSVVVPPKGQFKIIVNRPTGSCTSANTNLHNNAWVAGTVVSSTFNSDGVESGSHRIIDQNTGPSYNSPQSSWTYYSLSGESKLHWEIYPDASTWPSNCSQVGDAIIDFEGQLKTIIIW